MQLIENASKNKLRGGYYTPRNIADFILRWGMRDNLYTDILEPSCGDGVFLEALRESGRHFESLTAVEYDETEAEKARSIGIGNVISGDFHLFCKNTSRRFNLIVGNPPFIRYQYYNEQQQQLAAEIFKKANLKFSKLTNAWVTFIIGSSLLLQDKGRIGFVVPAELLQVGYALQLREFLSTFYNKITIISFKKLVFESIQQEVVVLLCEKDGLQDHLIDHIELEDDKELRNLNVFQIGGQPKKINFKSNKWTFYFLSQDEIDFIEDINRNAIPTISKYADIEVGITTGSNGYFTVPKSVVSAYQMEKYAYPMVGRSVQVSSCIFTKSDWISNQNKNAKSNLLIFPPDAKEKANEGTRNYILNGELLGINKGYKTRIRDYWYVIPSIKISDALIVRRNNLYPKLVLNEAKAYTTDTMHRVFIHDNVDKQAFVASYYNSLSLAFTEILGRSYGGGVLELMPGEATKIPLPYKLENAKILRRIDAMLRDDENITDILNYTDEIILKYGYGFTDRQIHLARSIWKKLSSRRLERGKSDVKPQKKNIKYEIPVGQEGYQFSLFEPSAIYQYNKDGTLLIASCRQGTKKWITTHYLYNYPLTEKELEENPELLNVKHIIIFNRKSFVGYYGVVDIKLVNKSWLKENDYPVKSSKRKADATYLLYMLKDCEMRPPIISANDCKLIIGKGVIRKKTFAKDNK
jgi:adenine-specific DNA-methyltransferase